MHFFFHSKFNYLVLSNRMLFFRLIDILSKYSLKIPFFQELSLYLS
jgi:hypothetical protein